MPKQARLSNNRKKNELNNKIEMPNFYGLKLTFINIEKRIQLIKNQKKANKENFKVKLTQNKEKIYLENHNDLKNYPKKKKFIFNEYTIIKSTNISHRNSIQNSVSFISQDPRDVILFA